MRRQNTSSRKACASADFGARFVAGKHGAAAVEFALVIPALLLLVVGAMELSIALYRGASVQWAVERAARAVSLNGTLTEADIQALVDADLARVGAAVEVDVGYSTEAGPELTLARITATYVHTVDIAFLPSLDIPFMVDVTAPRAD
ncbi:MAG: pilus assembly protein [Hyphomonadaceae bacterium]|nr:pilus assembly protein [Hyphomonadaceae bacterium]